MVYLAEDLNFFVALQTSWKTEFLLSTDRRIIKNKEIYKHFFITLYSN